MFKLMNHWLGPSIVVFFIVKSNMVFSQTAIAAEEINVIGTTPISISLENSPLDLVFAREYFKQHKTIRLSTIEISPKSQQRIINKAENIVDEHLSFGTQGNPSYVSDTNFNVDLKMANVPVLDQGSLGTCVTFSITAALDALKQAGDFVSQQCLLELSSTYYIPNNIEYDLCNNLSGWDGYFAECQLARVQRHGVVAKAQCLNKYPVKNKKLSTDEYKNLSFNGQWSKDFNWKFIESGNIEELKKALNNGNRVAMGFLINPSKIEYANGYPINNKTSGLWALPTSKTGLESFLKELDEQIANNEASGHEVIVVGYNDAQQVLKIRNSWGSTSGDNGEFYMTYDYYKLMAIDAIEISPGG